MFWLALAVSQGWSFSILDKEGARSMLLACNCANGEFYQFLTGFWQGFLAIFRLIANLACNTYYVHWPFYASDAYTFGFIVGLAMFVIAVSALMSWLWPAGRWLVLFVVVILIFWALTR